MVLMEVMVTTGAVGHAKLQFPPVLLTMLVGRPEGRPTCETLRVDTLIGNKWRKLIRDK